MFHPSQTIYHLVVTAGLDNLTGARERLPDADGRVVKHDFGAGFRVGQYCRFQKKLRATDLLAPSPQPDENRRLANSIRPAIAANQSLAQEYEKPVPRAVRQPNDRREDQAVPAVGHGDWLR